MTELFTWVKNIAYFFILISLVMNLVPGKQYKKYIKLFTGIILILIILSPVSRLFNLEDTLSHYLDMENYQLELEQLQYDLILADDKHYEMVISSYEDDIKRQIDIWVKEKGLYLLDTSVNWEMDSTSSEYGKIKGMSILVSKRENSIEENEIEISIKKIIVSLNSEEKIENQGSIEEIYLKNLIQDFYNIPINNINVSIQE